VALAIMTAAVCGYGQPAEDTAAAPADTAPAQAIQVSDSAVGALTVRSTPSGALVIADGMPVGETPVRIDSIAPGKHRLQLQLEGYLGKAATVLVSPGTDGDVEFAMVKPATVTVAGTPAGATVTLDSVELGPLPVRREGLKPGTHRIRVSGSGFSPLDTSIVLSEGVSDTITVSLAATTAPTPASTAAQSSPRPARGENRRAALIAAAASFVVFTAVILAVDLANDEE